MEKSKRKSAKSEEKGKTVGGPDVFHTYMSTVPHAFPLFMLFTADKPTGFHAFENSGKQ